MLKLNVLAKLLCVYGFLSIILSIFIVFQVGPSSGYEISIYSAYPSFYWMNMLSSIAIGLILGISSTFYPKGNLKYKHMGLIIILFSTTIYFLLPFFRAYYLIGRGDLPTHLGEISYIATQAHISQSNFYPITHILGTILYLSLDIRTNQLVVIISLIFYLFNIVNLYLLLSVVSKNRDFTIIIAYLATPLFYMQGNLVLSPYIRSMPIIILILFLFHKSREQGTNFMVCLIIVLLSLTFFHPISCIYWMIILLICSLTFYLGMFMNKVQYKPDSRCQNLYRLSGNLLMTSVILFFTWYLTFSFILKNFATVFKWLIKGSDTTVAHTYINLASSSRAPLAEIITVLIYRYGSIMILIFFTSLMLIYLIKISSNDRRNRLSMNELIYVVLWPTSVIIAILEMFNYSLEFEPIRNWRLCILLSPLVIAISINRIYLSAFKKNSLQKWAFIIFVFLFVANSLSILNAYPSPRIGEYNTQVTTMEIDRFVWITDHINQSSRLFARPEDNFERFNDLIYPNNKFKFGLTDISKNYINLGILSKTEYSNGNISYLTDNIITLKYPHKPFQIPPYTQKEIDNINSNSAFMKVYLNGECTVWEIEPR